MEPTQKSHQIESLLTDLFQVDRKKSITEDQCVACKFPATHFKDEISRREFSISGFCQKCQDKVFGGGDEE
jgi:hypothetical protein